MRMKLSFCAAALLAASVPAQIEIRVHGDDVTIRSDGKELSKDRVQRDGKKWRVLDADGKEIAFVVVDGTTLFDTGVYSRGDLLRGDYGKPVVGGRPRLGVVLKSVDEDLAEHLGLDTGKVLQVDDVTEGGPAAKAGVKAKDIVVAIEGDDDVTLEGIEKLLTGKKAGDKVELKVRRGGDTKTVGVKLEGAFESRRYFGDLVQTDPDQAARTLYSWAQGQKGEISRAVAEAMRAVEKEFDGGKLGKEIEKAIGEALRTVDKEIGGEKLGKEIEKAVGEAMRVVEKEFDEGKLGKEIEKAIGEALRGSKSALRDYQQYLVWPEGNTWRLGEYFTYGKKPESDLDRLEKRLEKIEKQLEELARGAKAR
jgi:hypothetical protein